MSRRISEELTRKEMIDPSIRLRHSGRRPQLETAGWYLRAQQKRHFETADLYEPPLDMFGADAVERWFTEKEVSEIVEFSKKLVIYSGGCNDR